MKSTLFPKVDTIILNSKRHNRVEGAVTSRLFRDQPYLLRIPFASDKAQLGVTGEDLLKALVPISGDIAPMVYVNDTLYQIVDSQSNLADEKSSFNLLGKIENTVSSSEEPKENFQANDDIVGAAVYQYGDNIVVEFEGKYWLYEHYHNTDFDGNSD